MRRWTDLQSRSGLRRRTLVPLVLCLVLLTLVTSGCRPRTTRKHVGYFGPTEPMETVVARINANNQSIPSLWSRHDFEALIVDEQGREHFLNGDGILMYRRPHEVWLAGDKPVVGRIFEVGADETEYWLVAPHELQTMWWGRFEHLGRPCVQDIPIRPDLLREVLGISTFDTNFLQQPAPVMRFNNDRDAYMFVWVYEGPDRLIAQKEIWYARQSLLPTLVLLFDEHGRIVLRAYLDQHRPVRVPGEPAERWPKVATRYDLFFPDSGSRMTFTLQDPMLTRNGIPRAGSIRRPQQPDRIPQQNVIQVDENCRD